MCLAVKEESESEEDEEDFLPKRKLQKKASGSKASSEQQAAAVRPVKAKPASGDRPAAKPRVPATQKVPTRTAAFYVSCSRRCCSNLQAQRAHYGCSQPGFSASRNPLI